MIQITSRPSSPKNPRAGSSLESHFKVFVFIKLFLIQSFGDVVLRILRILFCPEFSNDSERREQVFYLFLSSVSYSKIYSIHFKKNRALSKFCFTRKTNYWPFLKLIHNEIESAMFMFTLSMRGNLILTILSCENPSNIWQLNYREQMCGANKLTGLLELVLLRYDWISLFGHGTFQRYVFMLSIRFVRTSENGLSHKTWSHFPFAHHLDAY